MAIGYGQVTITTSPTAIITDDSDGQYVNVRNMGDNNSKVYIGDSEVSISTGHELIKNTEISLSLGPGEEVYGIVATGTQKVSFFATMNE